MTTQPLRPYTLAVPAHGFLFLSGQVGLSPETGALVAGGLKEQLWQALTNVAGILESRNLDRQALVKMTVFLTHPDDYVPMNQEYIRFFGDTFPARTCVIVQALPLGAKIEVEAIAQLP